MTDHVSFAFLLCSVVPLHFRARPFEFELSLNNVPHRIVPLPTNQPSNPIPSNNAMTQR